MKRIPLTKGKFAIVDDDDFIKLSKYKWCLFYKNGKTGLICNAVRNSSKKNGKKSRLIYMHREIMEAPSGLLVDHINFNSLDNRKLNLRVCTASQNQFHRRRQKHRKYNAKYKGIFYNKRRGKWTSSIGYLNRVYYLGTFNNQEDAAIYYNVAAQIFHGRFAVLNKIP